MALDNIVPQPLASAHSPGDSAAMGDHQMNGGLHMTIVKTRLLRTIIFAGVLGGSLVGQANSSSAYTEFGVMAAHPIVGHGATNNGASFVVSTTVVLAVGAHRQALTTGQSAANYELDVVLSLGRLRELDPIDGFPLYFSSPLGKQSHLSQDSETAGHYTYVLHELSCVVQGADICLYPSALAHSWSETVLNFIALPGAATATPSTPVAPLPSLPVP